RALLPAETRNYVSVITVALGGKLPVPGPPLPGVAPLAPAQIATTNSCAFTRPDGSVLVADCAQVTSVRAPQVEERATQAQSIVTIGSIDQGVRESEEVARRLVLSNGGHL